MPPEIILASQSPRRSELLAIAGFRFRVRATPVEETRAPGERPEDYVVRLAQAKAEASWQGRDEIVLGADTIVVLDGRVLEKPMDTSDARAMLRALSARIHVVMTGICLRHSRGSIQDVSMTRVRFVSMDDGEIEDYLASGEPVDKAGAYAIQGLASKFVERIEGCYFNVMGLPVPLIYRHVKALQTSG